MPHGTRSAPGADGFGRYFAYRWMKASAVSATSRQPPSMTSECPRLGISTISVTALLRRCFLNDALAIAHGTVWSFSPEMISNDPRAGLFDFTLTSVHGFKLAVAAWNSGT